MTYAERIDRVTRTLASVSDEEWARTGAETKEYFRDQARAADRVVLEAIREPTYAQFVRAGLDAPECDGNYNVIWQAMHAAIPRGEEGK